MIGDPDLKVSKAYGMLPAIVSGGSEGRTAADNMTVRNVFVIGPDKKVKLVIVYPMTTGRNFDEVLRVIDSLQLTAKHKVATPVNWKPGEDVIIAGSVSDDDAKKTYPDGWKAPRRISESCPSRSRSHCQRERARRACTTRALMAPASIVAKARLIGLPSQPTSDLIADAPQRRQQLFLNGVKEAIDRRRLAPKIAATCGGIGVIQTS